MHLLWKSRLSYICTLGSLHIEVLYEGCTFYFFWSPKINREVLILIMQERTGARSWLLSTPSLKCSWVTEKEPLQSTQVCSLLYIQMKSEQSSEIFRYFFWHTPVSTDSLFTELVLRDRTDLSRFQDKH